MATVDKLLTTISDCLKDIKVAYDEQATQLSAVVPTIMQVVQLALPKPHLPDVTKVYSYYDRQQSIGEIEKKLEEAYATATQMHIKNLPALENNERVYTVITAMMTTAGLSDGGYETVGTGRRSKWVRIPAGYQKDLDKHCTRSDGWAVVELNYKDAKAAIAKWRNEKEAHDKRAADLAEMEKAAKLRSAKKSRVLGALFVKYSLPLDATDSDLEDAILSKDKYLALASAMERNRGDWSDGYDYVDSALDHFRPAPGVAIDAEIVAELRGIINDADGDIDGRIFRDCQYNYTVLYGLADKSVMEDYQLLKEFCDE